MDSPVIYKLAFLSSFTILPPFTIYYKPALVLSDYYCTHERFAPADKTNASKLSNTK